MDKNKILTIGGMVCLVVGAGALAVAGVASGQVVAIVEAVGVLVGLIVAVIGALGLAKTVKK